METTSNDRCPNVDQVLIYVVKIELWGQIKAKTIINI